jgi:hypothetical protein
LHWAQRSARGNHFNLVFAGSESRCNGDAVARQDGPRHVTRLVDEFDGDCIADQLTFVSVLNDIDKVEVAKVLAWEAGLHQFLATSHKALLDKLNTGDWSDALDAELKAVMETYVKQSAI